jgi:hypothetical protein
MHGHAGCGFLLAPGQSPLPQPGGFLDIKTLRGSATVRPFAGVGVEIWYLVDRLGSANKFVPIPHAAGGHHGFCFGDEGDSSSRA